MVFITYTDPFSSYNRPRVEVVRIHAQGTMHDKFLSQGLGLGLGLVFFSQALSYLGLVIGPFTHRHNTQHTHARAHTYTHTNADDI